MKKIVSLLVMITIIIGASNTVEAYTGVQPWFVDEIEEANGRWHIIPKSFSGLDLRVDMTRAEFCEVLYRAYYMLYMDTPRDVEQNVFSDTNLNHVNVIHHLGIVSGYPDGTFRPDASVSRQEIFKMLHKFLTMYKGDYSFDSEASSRILYGVKDLSVVSDWAKDAVVVMKYEGIAGGDDKGRMNPKNNTTRAEGIIMIKRMLDSTVEKKIVLAADEGEDTKLSTSEESKVVVDPNYDAHDHLNELGHNHEKHTSIYGTGDFYTSQDYAIQMMKTITVDVWQIDASGNKYTAQISLTVNKNIADRVELVFKEIYNGPEKFPIHSMHSYAWRSRYTSEHNQGLAIDINPNQNYMIRDGRIIAGLYWKPYEDPLSITPDGDVVTAFNKYGFAWGGNYWRSSNDYMHFSYLGR